MSRRMRRLLLWLLPALCIAGVVVAQITLPGGGLMKLQDEGVDVAVPGTLNFIGSPVTCVWSPTPAPGRVDCTVTSTGGAGGGYDTVRDETTTLPQESVLRFTGTIATCVDGTSETICDITIPASHITTSMIADGQIVDADIAAGAAISVSKIEAQNVDVGDIPTCTGNDKLTSADGTTLVCNPDQTGASVGYDTIEVNGVAQTQRTTIDFVGVLVSCSDVGAETSCIVAIPMNSVLSTHIVDGTITNADLSGGAGITAGKLAGISAACNGAASKIDHDGTTFSCGTIAGDGHAIQEEGAALPTQPSLDFSGSTVTCADDPGNSATKCTVSSATDEILDGTIVRGSMSIEDSSGAVLETWTVPVKLCSTQGIAGDGTETCLLFGFSPSDVSITVPGASGEMFLTPARAALDMNGFGVTDATSFGIGSGLDRTMIKREAGAAEDSTIELPLFGGGTQTFALAQNASGTPGWNDCATKRAAAGQFCIDTDETPKRAYVSVAAGTPATWARVLLHDTDVVYDRVVDVSKSAEGEECRDVQKALNPYLLGFWDTDDDEAPEFGTFTADSGTASTITFPASTFSGTDSEINREVILRSGTATQEWGTVTSNTTTTLTVSVKSGKLDTNDTLVTTTWQVNPSSGDAAEIRQFETINDWHVLLKGEALYDIDNLPDRGWGYFCVGDVPTNNTVSSWPVARFKNRKSSKLYIEYQDFGLHFQKAGTGSTVTPQDKPVIVFYRGSGWEVGRASTTSKQAAAGTLNSVLIERGFVELGANGISDPFTGTVSSASASTLTMSSPGWSTGVWDGFLVDVATTPPQNGLHVTFTSTTTLSLFETLSPVPTGGETVRIYWNPDRMVEWISDTRTSNGVSWSLTPSPTSVLLWFDNGNLQGRAEQLHVALNANNNSSFEDGGMSSMLGGFGRIYGGGTIGANLNYGIREHGSNSGGQYENFWVSGGNSHGLVVGDPVNGGEGMTWDSCLMSDTAINPGGDITWCGRSSAGAGGTLTMLGASSEGNDRGNFVVFDGILRYLRGHTEVGVVGATAQALIGGGRCGVADGFATAGIVDDCPNSGTFTCPFSADGKRDTFYNTIVVGNGGTERPWGLYISECADSASSEIVLRETLGASSMGPTPPAVFTAAGYVANTSYAAIVHPTAKAKLVIRTERVRLNEIHLPPYKYVSVPGKEFKHEFHFWGKPSVTKCIPRGLQMGGPIAAAEISGVTQTFADGDGLFWSLWDGWQSCSGAPSQGPRIIVPLDPTRGPALYQRLSCTGYGEGAKWLNFADGIVGGWEQGDSIDIRISEYDGTTVNDLGGSADVVTLAPCTDGTVDAPENCTGVAGTTKWGLVQHIDGQTMRAIPGKVIATAGDLRLKFENAVGLEADEYFGFDCSVAGHYPSQWRVECNDGLDNDGVGGIDMNDADCSSEWDRTE